MADNKNYYYMRLKENFFDSDAMLMLETMPDGYIYSNILLKLYLRSLKNAGKLMFNDKIPYNSHMIASITRISIGIVEKALNIFVQLGLVEILDNGAIYMLDIQSYIGKSTTEADRKRAYRDQIEKEKNLVLGQMSRQDAGQITGQMSGLCPDKSTPEIELELEIEKEIDNTPLEKDKPKKSKSNTPTEQKIKFAEFIAMTNDEYQSLIANEQLGCEAAVKRCIEILDNYKGSTGRKYKSDYRAILSWVIDRYLEECRKGGGSLGKNISSTKESSNKMADTAGTGTVSPYGKIV